MRSRPNTGNRIRVTGPFILIVLLSLMFFSCTDGGEEKSAVDTPPIVKPCTVNGKLYFLALLPGNNSQGNGDLRRVSLSTPTYPVKALQHYWEAGKKATGNPVQQIVFLSKADGVAGVPFGYQSYHKIILEEKSLKVMAFQQSGEHWVFALDGVLYKDQEGRAVRIGTVELRTYRSPSGKERRALMTRLPADDRYCFESEGKVYQQETSGKVMQIGWMEWRVARLTSGDKVLIMMSKGMGEHAKWQGKHEGRLYLDAK